MAQLNVRAKMTMDARGFERDMKRAKSQAHDFGKGMEAVGKKMAAAFATIFIGGSLASGIRRAVMEVATMAKEIKKVQDSTGMAAGNVMRLKNWALSVGTSFESAAAALEKIRKDRMEIGSKPALGAAYSLLGINPKDEPENILDQITKRAQGPGSPAMDEAIQRVLGNDDMSLVRGTYKKTFSDEKLPDGSDIETFNKMLTELEIIKGQIVDKLVPVLTQVFGGIKEYLNLKPGQNVAESLIQKAEPIINNPLRKLQFVPLKILKDLIWTPFQRIEHAAFGDTKLTDNPLQNPFKNYKPQDLSESPFPENDFFRVIPKLDIPAEDKAKKAEYFGLGSMFGAGNDSLASIGGVVGRNSDVQLLRRDLLDALRRINQTLSNGSTQVRVTQIKQQL